MIKREHHQEFLLTISEALLLQPLKQRAGENRERIQQGNRVVAPRVSTIKKFVVCENLPANVVFVAIIMTCVL